MNSKGIFIFLSILSLVAVFAAGYWTGKERDGAAPPTPVPRKEEKNPSAKEAQNAQLPPVFEDGPNPDTLPPLPEASGLIKITSPRAGDRIKSPVRVTGEARGTWYFEASFPVKIVDMNGRNLGSAPVQAEGDWMTGAFVPFSGVIDFKGAKPGESGEVVFERDNPSGLPANAAEVRIPVVFY